MFSYLGLTNFIAELQAPLNAEDVTPSIRADKHARLCATLSNGAHTYLSLECPGGFEIVKATCQSGVVLLDRGEDGTSAQPFPIGSCLRFAFFGASIIDLINETLTCPKPCLPATIASGSMAPDGQVGVPYSHRIVISGTPPFALGAFQVPAWMDVTLDAGEIRLSGTPDVAGTVNIAIPLKSCGVLAQFFVACIAIAAAGAGGGGT